MSQPGAIGHGVPPRPNDVQRELRDLQRQINEMHGMIVQATNAANAATVSVDATQVDINSTNIATSQGEYGVTTLTVPDGFTQAFVNMFAGVGSSLTAAGSVSVMPVIDYLKPTELDGPAINSGDVTSGPVVASSFFGAHITGLTGGQSIRVSCLAIRVGAASSGSGNVHVTSTWLFTR